MAFQLTKKEILYFNTKEEVREFCKAINAMGGTDSEREVKAMRKRNIKEKLLSPLKRPFCFAVALIPALGISQRVDGQHSCEVMLELTDEEWNQVLFPVIIDYEEYTCETRKDAAILFEQFNPHWSARSTEDLAGAHMGIHEHLKHMPRKLGNALTSGLLWYATKLDGQQKKSGMQFEYFHSNHDVQPFLTWADKRLNLGNKKHLLNAPVVAAMYHTTRNNEAARGLWEAVASGYETHAEDTIAYKLDYFLHAVKNPRFDWSTAIRKQFVTHQERPSEKDIFGTCLRAVSRALKNVPIGEIFLATHKHTFRQLVDAHYPMPEKKAA